jgi:hypothetical protein
MKNTSASYAFTKSGVLSRTDGESTGDPASAPQVSVSICPITIRTFPFGAE